MVADLLARVRVEIDARLSELRPALAEYERLLDAAGALGLGAGDAPGALAPSPPAGSIAPVRPRRSAKPRRPVKARRAAGPRRTSTGAAEQAIVAALEHGSHTAGELGVVTALSAAEIREGVRRLRLAGKIARAEREGRTAYALSGTA